MKVKRIRNVKKILNFYKNNYAFAPPYRILVDGTFCHAALKVQVNIANELPKYLGVAGTNNAAAAVTPSNASSSPNDVSARPKDNRATDTDSVTRAPISLSSSLASHPAQYEILTTNCCVKELEKIGTPVYGALCVLRQFALKPCGHLEPIPAIHCLLSILKKGNPSKLMLSTVDPELTEMVRKIAGVPLIFLHGATMVLEKATNKSFKVAEEETKNAIAEDQEIRRLKDMKRKEGLIKDPIRKVGKKKKAKGPNPLAVKKKKKTN